MHPPPPTHAFDGRLWAKLPPPLAPLYRAAANERDPLRAYLAAHNFWEAGLKLLAAAVVSEYARRPDRTHKPELKSLARPSLGHWWKYLKLLLPELASADGPARRAHAVLFTPQPDLPHATRLDGFLKRLPADGRVPEPAKGTPPAKVDLNKLFDQLVECRNRELGHGAAGRRGDPFYEALGRHLLDGVADCFARLHWPRALFVDEVRYEPDGRVTAHGLHLTGGGEERFAPIELPAALHGRFLPHRVYLDLRPAPDGAPSVPDAAHLCPLHPLAVYDGKHLLFLNTKFGKPRSEYLCYVTGAAREVAALDADHRKLLADLVGAAVRADDLNQWADATFAEEGPPPAPAWHVPPTAAGRALDELLAVVGEAVLAAESLSVTDVRAAFRRAAPPNWELEPAGGSAVALAADCCHLLSRAPVQASGACPVLVFVLALLPRLPASFAERLLERVAVASAHLGERLPAPVASAPNAAPADAPPTTAYFVVAVQPAEVTAPGEFFVRAWFDPGTGPGPALYESGPHPPDGVRRAVRAAHAAAHGKFASRRDTWVEFVLPRELLAGDVDQWPVEVDGLFDNPVGAEHPVVVRAADRWKPGLPREQSEALRARGRHLGAPGPAAVLHDLPPAGRSPFALCVPPRENRTRWLYNNLKDDREVLCAVFDAPPVGPAPPDEFAALVRVGVPVVAWARAGAGVVARLAELLAGEPLAAVPVHLYKWRAAGADGPDDHYGRHVGLVWDDPARPPPGFGPAPFRPPTFDAKGT